ncbi:MAG: BadF/BadG/BcrA/BcrD ATPase family protein [Pseudomonadota bacterium]
MDDPRMGLFSTVPVEILVAAGFRPLDVNNAFIGAPEPRALLERAEAAGLPRTLCAWTRGLYATTLALGLPRIITVFEGDCSANRAMAELLRDRGVDVLPFRYPLADRTEAGVQAALEELARRLGTTLAAAEAVRADLAPLRSALESLDRLTWDEGRLSGAENHRWLVSSSDLGGGDAAAFLVAINAAIGAAACRDPAGRGPRLGLFGVPPALTDLHGAVEAAGARVIFNEVASDFAMTPPATDLADQYRRYAYPYGVEARGLRAIREADRRGVDAWVVYDQSFCHHNLERPAVDRLLGDRPRLHLEGDAPGPVGARDRIRLEAFIRTLARPRSRLRQPTRTTTAGGSPPALGLDLGSRFAKLAYRDPWGDVEVRILDSMQFYRTWARRTATGLALDLPAVLRDGLGVRPPAGLRGVATGYGRHLEGLVGCHAVPEVHAHAAGAAAQLGPGEFLLADLGGQDTKAIRVRDGVVLDFVMNDRCAAGSGRYVENMARLLEVELAEVMAHHADPVVLSNVCAIFGESEVVGLVVEGIPVERISAGILRSVAMRLLQLLGRLPAVGGLPLYLSGGLAASPGLLRLLEIHRGGDVASLPRPRLSGALGCLELATAAPTP